MEQPRPIPLAESTDAKEVFAFFGLASYCAQVLEQEMLLLAAFSRLRGQTKPSPERTQRLLDHLDAQTLAGLLREAGNLVPIPHETERLAFEAIQARNALVHRFFAKHDVRILSEEGRLAMIAELRKLAEVFQAADAALIAIREPISTALGITPEVAQAELQGMLDGIVEG